MKPLDLKSAAAFLGCNPEVLRRNEKYLSYYSLGDEDGYFTNYGGDPRSWFHANHEKFLFPLESIRRASKPYGDAPWGCGVYFLFMDDELLYVGLSVRIGQRMGQHRMKHYNPWFNRYTAIWVPEALMRDVEDYYITKLDPPLNERRWAASSTMRPYLAAQDH